MKNIPDHFDLLSEADKLTYNKLNDAIKTPVKKIRFTNIQKNREFQEIIDALLLYINHDDNDKWKRSLVVGLYQFDNGIALNISSLKKLLKRCKTSINQSFKDIGYYNVTTRASFCSELLENIPFLKNNFNELKHWTVRFKGNIPDYYMKDKIQKCTLTQTQKEDKNKDSKQETSFEESPVEGISDFDFSTSSFDPFEEFEDVFI